MWQPQELYEQPASLLVADFVGENNLLDGRLVERLVNGSVVVEIEGSRIVADARSLNGAAPGEGVVLAVRPESFDVTSADTGDGISGTVIQTVYGGARWRVVIRTSADTVLSIDLPSERARALELGSVVHATPRAGQAIAFSRTQDQTP